MNFSDLVKKLDELVNTQEVELDPKTGKPVEDPQQTQQPAQPGGPVDRPIPGQQPNLGPKTTVQPQQPPVAVQPQQAPAQAQPQQPADGMAAAILQALGQLKQQNPLSTATTSQSIAAQKTQSQSEPLQQTHKPGEPTEDIDVNEDAPKKTVLSDKEISDWIYSLNSNPSNIQSDNWKNIDPESKKKIILSDKLKPTAYDYVQAHNRLNVERKKDKPDEQILADLEKARKEAWAKHNATPPEKAQADNKAEPKTDTKKDTKVDSTSTAIKPTADQITQQEKIAQALGTAYANAKDPAQKEAALKAYQEAGAKLAKMTKDAGAETPPANDTKKNDAGEKKAQVSASELQKFRDEQSNQNITLGQYLNYKNKLSAVKGGANDPEVIQKKLGDKGVAWDPNAKKDSSDSNSTIATNPKPTSDDKVGAFLKAHPGVTYDKDSGQFYDANKKHLGSLNYSLGDDSGTIDISGRPDFKTDVAGVHQAPVKIEPLKVTPVTVEPPASETKPSTYQPIKTDSQGKKYLDPFNIGPKIVSPDTSKLQPGEGPVVRNTDEPAPKAGEVKPVKEMSLQSVVDDLLQEDKVAKEDSTSTASKWATKSAKLAPWAGNLAKGANIALSASDIADYTKKGDKVGAGIASAALAADAIGSVFPPASWASFALDAANAGRDVYLKQTGQDYKDPDEKQMQAKEELSNIVHLSKYKVDKK